MPFHLSSLDSRCWNSHSGLSLSFHHIPFTYRRGLPPSHHQNHEEPPSCRIRFQYLLCVLIVQKTILYSKISMQCQYSQNTASFNGFNCNGFNSSLHHHDSHCTNTCISPSLYTLNEVNFL